MSTPPLLLVIRELVGGLGRKNRIRWAIPSSRWARSPVDSARLSPARLSPGPRSLAVEGSAHRVGGEGESVSSGRYPLLITSSTKPTTY